MKSIIALSLASLSLQGIILGQPRIQVQPTLLTQNPGFVNQVNQIHQFPIKDTSFQPINGFNPLYQRHIKHLNMIRPVPIISQPINTFVPMQPMNTFVPMQPIVQQMQPIFQPIQPIVQQMQPIVTSVQPGITSVQGIVQPVQQVITPINNENLSIQNQCRISGVYKQLCLSKDIQYANEMSGITYNKKYDCFDQAICAFKDNKCQWFKTKKFKKCMRRVKAQEALSQDRSSNYYSN